jgi:hypothetical protein
VNDLLQAHNEHFKRGQLLDLRTGDPSQDDPAHGSQWEPDRTIDAVTLTELLLGNSELLHPRGIQIAGARITGTLDLHSCTLARPLVLTECWLEHAPDFEQSHVPALELLGCHMPGLIASHVDIDKNCRLARTFITGRADLTGAHIGGSLDLFSAQLALWAYGLKVSNVLADRVRVDGGVRLAGAAIDGQMVFSNAQLTSEDGPALEADGLKVSGHLFFPKARVEGGVRLVGAAIDGQVVFNGAQLTSEDGPALEADRLKVSGYVDFRGACVEGGVHLGGAAIEGHLGFEGAQLASEDRPALMADGLKASGGVLCEGARVEGGVRLTGAAIDGQVVFNGAQLVSKDGPALAADGLKASHGVYCEGARVEGEVRLVGAAIDGQVVFNGAQLVSKDGPALMADRLKASDGRFQEARVEGGVRLVGAAIDGQLVFHGVTLTGSSPVLDLEAAVLGQLSLGWAAKPTGSIDLTAARVGTLVDPGLDGDWMPTRLDGCVYDTLRPEGDVSDRLKWLRSDDRYEPQRYEQLATSYRRTGKHDAATRVAIAKQRHRREGLSWHGKAWGTFIDATVGYGYRLWLAGLWLVGLFFVGTVLFHTVLRAGMDPAGEPSAVPDFNPAIYTVDALVPVLSLGQRDGWVAGGAAQWVTFAFTVVGWLLAAALMAGLIVRRQ